MTALFAGDTIWVVAVITLAVATSVVSAWQGWVWDVQRARLPDATRYEDVKTRLELAQRDLVQLEDRKRQLEQQMQDRDRLVAEVIALEQRLETLRAEVAGLASAEPQIEEMKRRAADAVAEFSDAKGALDEVLAARAAAERALQAIEQRLEAVQHDIEDCEGQTKIAVSRLGEVRTELAMLEAQRASLKHELADFVDQLAQMASAKAEVAALESSKHRLQRDVEASEARLAALAPLMNEADQAVQRLRDEQTILATEVVELRLERQRLEEIRSDLAALLARKEALNIDIASMEEKRSGMLASADNGAAGDSRPEPELKELRQLPFCLVTDWPEPYPPEPEEEAVYRVTTHLKSLGLQYGDRTVRAFHTALKINDASQLTVLAGVSGTGKSLLPRRYAEAMGVRFLQIAVEPRWDSPQDLLGFYNYIEKGYRATDLARALVHMDPYGTSGLEVEPVRDQMLLVLLDEMNLARVEYYFSEFLSRLEVRPQYNAYLGAESRTAASLPIDLPGRTGSQVRLFPSHNVLFAGTMNDDESTQSLSDKVLDRSNVLQFAAPDLSLKPAGGASVIPVRYRSFEQWRKWIKPTASLQFGERDKANQVVRTVAEILEAMGRPFGHRLNDAILAYATNYPRDKGIAIETPLADQIEMRILPKLRGLAIDDHKTAFDDLHSLILNDLGDRHLADCFKTLVDRQRDANGQFNWRGYNREET